MKNSFRIMDKRQYYFDPTSVINLRTEPKIKVTSIKDVNIEFLRNLIVKDKDKKDYHLYEGYPDKESHKPVDKK
ncbi:MAG: hypothetical protein NTW25_06480 [Candidatus Kapabacteria bacterium]|nr:hypothetical protein [Candidatus Kapabacteria bacterium]